MEDDTEWKKLPTEEKCVHKLWKVRVSGYEEASKAFQLIDDEKSGEWNKYLGLVKKFVSDSNAVALEKGLEALLHFLSNAAVAGKTTGEVMPGVIKCLAAPKAKTKELALEICLMYIEIEKYDLVLEELVKGLGQKNPKVVAACIFVISESLRLFGAKVISIKPLIKQIPVMLEDRDKNVRDEGKKLVVEMYRWLGPALKPQLKDLKPVQLTELEAEFEKQANDKPIQLRFLRSQQDLKIKMEKQAEQDADGDETEDQEGPAEIDVYEIAPAFDILGNLPKGFYENIEAKKWQERREVLDALKPLTENIKFENGDYGDLVKVLRKVIQKDSNVMIVALAGTCLAGLARGLKKSFSPYALSIMQVIFEKFKEKKINVVTAMREASDAVFISTNLESLQEDIISYLDNKNPSIKTEVALFLVRCFQKSTPDILNKKLLKSLCASLIRTLNEPDPVVRDASAEALGTAMKVVGEKGMAPFLTELDSLKQAKIKEYYDKAELLIKQPKVNCDKPSNAAPKRPVKVVSAAKTEPKVQIRNEALKKPVKKVVKKANVQSKTAVKSPTEEVAEAELGFEEACSLMESMVDEDLLSGLSDSNWKIRLTSVEQLQEVIKSNISEINPQACIILLNKKPGFKDNNFQVLKLRLEALLYLSESVKLSKTSVNHCLTDLVDKLGDPKNGPLACEVLFNFAESITPHSLSSDVLEHAFDKQKSPKVQMEALNWVSKVMTLFGICLSPLVIEYIKKALAATGQGVRASGLNVIATLYLFMGSKVKSLFQSEKSSVIQLIETELSKVEGDVLPEPSRGTKFNSTASEVGDSGETHEGSPCNSKPCNDDFLPRMDISDKITDSLIADMGDKNWKVRNEALSRLLQIIQESGPITPNLNDLPLALKARLADSNKILATQALKICHALIEALGSQAKQYSHYFLPGILQSLSDNKSQVRAISIGCLDVWCEKCSFRDMWTGEIMADALKIENPFLRADLFGWLAENMPKYKTLPKDDLTACLPYLYSCIEDRNPDVRKKAGEAVLPFMLHLGSEAMVKAANRLRPTSKMITPALEKARGNLPIKSSTVAVVAPMNKNTLANTDPESVQRGKMAKPGANRAKPAAAKTIKKKEEETDDSPTLPINNQKTQRMLDEQKLKVIKWNFMTPKNEYVEQLKDQMNGASFNKVLMTHLFHADFKFHIKAIDMLSEDLNRGNFDALISNLDLILKWMTLRFFETNPSVIIRGLEYILCCFNAISDNGNQLTDHEATCFIPYLLLKVGDPKDAVRSVVKQILRLLCQIFSPCKIFTFIMDGLKTKNSRQRAECLEELGNLIENFGISICGPSPSVALKEIGKQIGDRDNSVRNAALNAMVKAYNIEGDKVYKYVGQLSAKDMSLLEERIKRAGKTRVTPPAEALPILDKPNNPKAIVGIKPVPNTGVSQQNVNNKPAPKYIETPAITTTTSCSKGTFSLDIVAFEEQFDESEKVNYNFKLNEPKIDDILYSDPITLPETKAKMLSTSIKSLCNSPDVQHGIDLAFSQIAATSSTSTLAALLQINQLLKEEEYRSLFEDRVEQFIIVCIMQYRMNHKTRLTNPSCSRDEVMKIFKNLTNTLTQMFIIPELSKKVTTNVIHDLVQCLITLMLESAILELEDGSYLLKSFNILIIKIVERSDATSTLCALFQLLREAVGEKQLLPRQERYVELVMKCIWKAIRYMNDNINQLNIDLVLLEFHKFFLAYPTNTWKDKSNDIPLRTLKTALHTLAKLKGKEIMKHFTLISMPENSEVYKYTNKVLLKVDQGCEKNGRSAHLINSKHEILTDIFKKIGSKEHNKEGLVLLYDFKQRTPDADIGPFLQKSSQFFQNYIEKGLKRIEEERKSGKSEENDKQNRVSQKENIELGDSLHSNTNSESDCNTEVYLERLRILRARAGLDNKKVDSNSYTVGNKSEVLNTSENSPSSREYRSSSPNHHVNNLELIKKRLEQIRSSK